MDGHRRTAPPTLRGYQFEAVEAVERADRGGQRRVLVDLPTGTGKTVVFSEVIRRRGGRALVIAHREELLDQATNRLVDAGVDPDQIGRVKGPLNATTAPVIVGSVQTLSRRSRLDALMASQVAGGRFRTVVIDEAHHAVAKGYRLVLDALDEQTLVLGITATPGREGLTDIFGEPVFSRDLRSMIRDGWLCDLRGRRVRIAVELSNLHRQGGDYAKEELVQALKRADAPLAIAKAWAEEAGGRPSLVFTPSVDLARATAEAFTARGVSAGVVVGETPPDERREILRGFSDGAIQVLVNCDVLTEGVDLPHVQCVVIGRPTLSPVLYAQMVGRGTRLSPGKKDCLILDLAGATDRHKLDGLGRSKGPQNLSLLAGEELEEGMSLLEKDRERQAQEDRRDQRFKKYGTVGEVMGADVPLFKRGPYQWLTVPVDGVEVHALQLGDKGFIAVWPDDGATYRPSLFDSEGVTSYRHRTTLSDALALGGKWAQRLGGDPLALADSEWRKGDPKPGPIRYLRSFHPVDDDALKGLTAGDVSDLITCHQVRARLAGRPWRSLPASA